MWTGSTLCQIQFKVLNFKYLLYHSSNRYEMMIAMQIAQHPSLPKQKTPALSKKSAPTGASEDSGYEPQRLVSVLTSAADWPEPSCSLSASAPAYVVISLYGCGKDYR